MTPMTLATACGPWAVVTGASSGIGRALALELAAAGLDLVLVARREDRLAALGEQLSARGRAVRLLPLDLTAEGAVEAVVARTADLDVGLVVHAAGVGWGGPHEGLSLDGHLRMLALNCRATLELAHRFQPRLAARGRGGLVLLASVVGFAGAPWSAHYAATKAYVLSLGEGLQHEWARHGLDVTVVAPGPTATEFFEVASLSASRASTPEEVARVTVARLGRRGVVLPDWLGFWIRVAMSTAPRWLGVRILGRVMAGMSGVSGAGA